VAQGAVIAAPVSLPRPYRCYIIPVDARCVNYIIAFKSLPGPKHIPESLPISDPTQVNHFYGRDTPPRVRYVREKKRLDYGKAHEDEYSLELLESE
jgi:hypothetical protein